MEIEREGSNWEVGPVKGREILRLTRTNNGVRRIKKKIEGEETTPAGG